MFVPVVLLALAGTACQYADSQSSTPPPTTQVAAQAATNAQATQPAVKPVAAVTDDEVCFMPLAQNHRQQLNQYVTPRPGNGQSVCLLEQEPDGEFEQQYYAEGDSFPDFWYYVLLTSTVRTSTFSAGVIGDPTEVEYIALMYLTPVNKYNQPYTAFELDKRTGKWSARTTDKPIKIKHVKYGKAAPGAPNTAAKPPAPPSGYVRQPSQPSQGGTNGARDAEKRNTPPPVVQAPAQQPTQKPAPKPAPVPAPKPGKK